MPSSPISVIATRLGEEPLVAGSATFLNFHSYLSLRKRSNLLDGMDRIYVDGFALQVALRALGVVIARRSMDLTSLAPIVLSEAAQSERRIALIGGPPGTAEKAAEVLHDLYPQLQFVMASPGYFRSEADRARRVFEIVRAKPDLLLVGMGAVEQERLLLRVKEQGWAGVGYTCGAFLEQTAESGAAYYPDAIHRLNLRWLYRIYKQPRLLSRYAARYPLGMLCLLYDWTCWRLDQARSDDGDRAV